MDKATVLQENAHQIACVREFAAALAEMAPTLSETLEAFGPIGEYHFRFVDVSATCAYRVGVKFDCGRVEIRDGIKCPVLVLQPFSKEPLGRVPIYHMLTKDEANRLVGILNK